MKPENTYKAQALQDELSKLVRHRQIINRATASHSSVTLTIRAFVFKNREHRFDLRLFRDGPLAKFLGDCRTYIDKREKEILKEIETL